VPGLEQYITFDLEDIKTYKNPPSSALDRNEISVAMPSSEFVAEFEKMLRRKRWMKSDNGNPKLAVSQAPHVIVIVVPNGSSSR